MVVLKIEKILIKSQFYLLTCIVIFIRIYNSDIPSTRNKAATIRPHKTALRMAHGAKSPREESGRRAKLHAAATFCAAFVVEFLSIRVGLRLNSVW
jgi:hypothetical protein